MLSKDKEEMNKGNKCINKIKIILDKLLSYFFLKLKLYIKYQNTKQNLFRFLINYLKI